MWPAGCRKARPWNSSPTVAEVWQAYRERSGKRAASALAAAHNDRWRYIGQFEQLMTRRFIGLTRFNLRRCGDRNDRIPVQFSGTDTQRPEVASICPALIQMESERTTKEEDFMMNRSSSRFLVTTAVLLAGVGLASAQGVSSGAGGGAGGAASKKGMSAGGHSGKRKGRRRFWSGRRFPQRRNDTGPWV